MREGPLPVPESPGRGRVICVIEANGKCIKGMLGAEQRRKIDKYADLTPGIIQPVLTIAGRFHTGSVQSVIPFCEVANADTALAGQTFLGTPHALHSKNSQPA